VKTNVLEGKRYFNMIIKQKVICEGYGQNGIFLRGGLCNFQKKKQFLPSKNGSRGGQGEGKGRAKGAMGKNRASRPCV